MAKKIFILVNHEVVIYNFRLELVERLLDEGYEVYISSPHGEKIDELISMGCKYIPVSLARHGKNVIEDLKLIFYYKKNIKEINPDVVLSFTIKPNIYGGMACRLLGVPYIANITGLGTAVENKGLIQKLSIILYRISFKKINRVFFQNIENMQFFIDNKISIEKHKLIPGSGVNLKRYTVLDFPPNDVIHFVFISRIMKEKGIEQYLEAAQYIKNKYPNTEFHICGFCEETYEEKLSIFQSKGVIQYHGMVRDIREVLKKCHCTIHPTYYPEGMSNVLLESAACGRPIIATDRSGCREIIDDKINGFIIEQKNSNDLIKKIEQFLELSYKEKINMGLKGRLKVEREFDREIVVDSYIKEINTILAK
ncbi:glycosyl transferase [Lederbergia ruris]|uniref:Glycosyl transferase n=1 Tax=Lederbergia ruris TaxID=217495 RepID=A0ABQ4KMV1_9BACI|nr:glycosyltransferase family 4 protein [Lederbergia ruris]GIN58829.1 glycosyl transferase [Lederbergia ruris]